MDRSRRPAARPALHRRRWRPSALIWASFALHGLALAAWIWRPGLWPWWLGALVANHLILTLAGLWPRSSWLGENWRSLPDEAAARRGIALTIDDGPDPEVTPQVLDLLAQHGVKATFFCIGHLAETHPALVARICAEGHGVENHSFRHRHHFSLYGPGAICGDIAAGQAALGRLTGRAPGCFRAPAGLRNPFLEPVLARLGLRLVSWTRRGFDTRERDPGRVLARLAPAVLPGAILLLHDGHAARMADGRPVILDVLPALIARIRAAGLTPMTLQEAFCREDEA